MSWVEAVPVVLVALVVLYWPVPLLLASLRLPPLAATAIAPAVGVLVLVVSAVVADRAGGLWAWPWVLGTAATLMVGLLVGRRLTRGRRASRSASRSAPQGRGTARVLGLYLAGIVPAGLVMAPTVLGALVSPDSFSQRHDNIFHLNAAHLAASGHGSTLNLLPVTSNGFYPAAWHDWVGFVIQLSGADVRVATQAATLAVVFVVWPLSLAWLVETVLRPGLGGRLALGPLALSSVSFPLTLAGWGTLYPNLLGIALSPVLLAAGWDALGRRSEPALGLGSAITVGAITAGAVAIAHPNAALTIGLYLLPVALVALWPLLRRGDLRAVRGSRWWTLAVCGFVVAFPLVWYRLGAVIAAGSVREPFLSPDRAIGEIVAGTSIGRPPVASLAIGLVLGLLAVAFTRGLRSLLVSFALVSMAYFAAVALETHPVPMLLTAPYYSDSYRIAAVATVLVVPLAVLGWDTLARVVTERVRPNVGMLAAGALAVLLLVATSMSTGMRVLHDEVHMRFVADETAWVLTPPERALIERLPQTTPDDALLVVNPSQGGSLAYAIADRRVTHYYMNTPVPPAAELLAQRLHDAATDPAVCAAVKETGAGYALVLEPYEIAGVFEQPTSHPGLVGLDTASGFEVVDSEGESTLYRITACD